MPLIKILYIYGSMLVAFLAVDLLWLGVIAKNLYKNQIGFLMKSTPNWIAAIIFYLLFIVGILIFAVLPGVEKNSLQHTLIYGALFGFFTYMTYELTNFAVIKNWPFPIVPIDIAWGVVLATVVSLVGFFVAKI
jgi:uncharacterized membrane protein